LNGDTVVSRTKSISYENALVSVGALINSSVPSYHFNGQFEMLAHSDQIFDDAKVTLIRNSYQTIAYESEYDVLGRKEKDELSIGTTKRTADYTYKRHDIDPTKTSFEVEHMKTLANQNIYYNYDALGNVTEMDTPEGTYEYKYDFMGRLIEEYNPVLNQTIKMEYDKQNMIFKRFYAGKTTNLVKQLEFLTNAEDQLVYVGSLEGATETPLDITYDPKYVGNPLSIGTKQLTWEGRRLKQIIDGTNTFTYSYNEQGLRTKKNINGVETKYYLQGSNIIAEEKNGQTMHYIYNEQNQLVGFEHQQSKYFYVRDLLGVIRNVIDINGNIVVTYKYDAWGNHKVYDSSNAENTSSSFIGNISPFRYKGYYYDVETEWYYLQSRYYSPLLSRFIIFDDVEFLEPENISGLNLVTYCSNNSTMFTDKTGTTPGWLSAIGSTVENFARGIGALLKFSLKSLPHLSLKQAIKMARDGGHIQSARSIIRGREKTISETVKLSKNFKNIAKWAGRAMLVVDIGFSIYDNYTSGRKSWISDSMVDVLISVGIYALGAIPFVGWAIAIAAAITVNYYSNNTTVIRDIKDWVSDVSDEVVNGWNQFWSFNWA